MDAGNSGSSEPRWLVVSSVLAAVFLLSLHALAVVKLADRPLHYDETEYLHASWLMAAGERIYIDFFEDHPPHLFLLLNMVRPEADENLQAVDVREWTHRARLLSGVFGTLALFGVMLVSWRITGSAAAGAIAGALLLCGPQLWARGLSDVRAEPFTLALFWWGVLLILWRSELSASTALRHGAGLGMLLVVALWNPKWPLVSVVIGFVYLTFLWRAARSRRRLVLFALAPAAVLLVAGVVPILATATMRDYLFFNFLLKARQLSELSGSDWMVEFFRRNPLWRSADPFVRWWIVAGVSGAVAGVLLFTRRRVVGPNAGRTALPVALAVAALLEVRFVYTYPHIWAQYLVMLAFAAALLYSVVPTAIARMLQASGHGLVQSAYVVMLLTAGTIATIMLVRFTGAAEPSARYWNAFWKRQAHLQASVPRGGSVWISPPRHPVAARDASYYWYSFREAAPNAMAFQRANPGSPLPALQPRDLPPCRLLRGEKPGPALIEIGPWVSTLDVCDCAEGLVRLERVTPSPHFGIFETQAPATADGVRHLPRWYYESAGVWPSLCRWNQFVADEREFERAARGRKAGSS